MSYIPGSYPSRLVCSVLDEIRTCHKTRNYSGLLGLVEEVQTLANRMEAGLQDKTDLRELRDILRDEKEELRQLRVKIKKAQKKLQKLE